MTRTNPAPRGRWAGVALLRNVTLLLCAMVSASFVASASAGTSAGAQTGAADQAGATAAEPTGSLTLEMALSLALAGNPDLAAESWQVRVEEAETQQAGARPNPELGVELENIAGSGASSGLDGAETTVSLSQRFELGGKRGKRVGVARLNQALATWSYESRRLDVADQVTRAFDSVLAAQERLLVAADLVEVSQRSLATVSRRVRAGAVSPVEATRAEVALSTSRLQQQIAEQGLQLARRQLATLWGNPSPRFQTASGTLGTVGETVALEALLPLVGNNPDVARWGTEVQRHEADVALQRALGRPDVALMGGVRHMAESSDVGFLVGVDVPLPTADRNQGGQRAAAFRVERAGAEQTAARLRAETALIEAHVTWIAASREIAVLDEEILPQAEKALRTAQDAYERGLFQLTDVLDTRRTLFELRAQRIDALEQYHHALSSLERLIGRPLTELGRE